MVNNANAPEKTAFIDPAEEARDHADHQHVNNALHDLLAARQVRFGHPAGDDILPVRPLQVSGEIRPLR